MSRTTSNVRRNTAIGLTAGLLGGGAIGLMLGVPTLTSAGGSSPLAVVAQQDTPTDDTTADTTDDTGVTDEPTTVTDDTTVTDETTTDELPARPEPGVRLREKLQELVDDGTLTSEQADTVAEFLVESRPERDGHGRFPGGLGGHGRWHGGFGIEGGVIAELFGLDRDDLRDLLREGESLADVATTLGIDVQAVIDTVLDATEEHLDDAVADGRITQEDADDKLADLTERITEMINAGRPTDD